LCNIRLDLAFYAGLISRYLHNLRLSPPLATKRITRYVKGTLNSGVLFPTQKDDKNARMIGYSDAN
jgi:hypothetical protein